MRRCMRFQAEDDDDTIEKKGKKEMIIFTIF